MREGVRHHMNRRELRGTLHRDTAQRRDGQLQLFIIVTLTLVGLLLFASGRHAGYATIEQVEFSASLSREQFRVGELVEIMVAPPDAQVSVSIVHPSGAVSVLDGRSYIPDAPGAFLFNTLLEWNGLTERVVLPFSVIKAQVVNREAPAEQRIGGEAAAFPMGITVGANAGNGTLKNASTENATAAIVPPVRRALPPPSALHGKTRMDFSIRNADRQELDVEVEILKPSSGKIVYVGEGEDHRGDIDRGYYAVHLRPRDARLPSIEFRDVLIDQGLTAVADIHALGTDLEFRNAYAINPTAEFSSATVTSIARGNTLYKCKDWDFATKRCNGRWEIQQTLTPGTVYSFTLTPEDPAWGESSLFTLLPMEFPTSECPDGTALSAANLGNINVSDNTRFTCPLASGDDKLRAEMLNFTHNFTDVNRFVVNCSIEYINEAVDPAATIGTLRIFDKAGNALLTSAVNMPSDTTSPDSVATGTIAQTSTFFEINDTQDLQVNITNDDTGAADDILTDYLWCTIDFGLEPRWNVTRYVYDAGALNATVHNTGTVTLNVDRTYDMVIQVKNNRTNTLGNLSTSITDQTNGPTFIITSIADTNGSGVGDLHPDDGGSFGPQNLTYVEDFQSDYENYSAFTGTFAGNCGATDPDDDRVLDINYDKVFLRQPDIDLINTPDIGALTCGYFHAVFNITELSRKGSENGLRVDWVQGAQAVVPSLFIMNTTSGTWNNVTGAPGATSSMTFNVSGSNVTDFINSSDTLEVFIGTQGSGLNPKIVSDYLRVALNISDNATVRWNDPGLYNNASMTHFDTIDEEANFTYTINANRTLGAHTFYFRAEGGQTDAVSNITVTFTDQTPPNVSFTNSSSPTFNQNAPVNVSANVTDNINLSVVFTSFWTPNGTKLNVTMFNSTVAWNTTNPPNNFTTQFNETSQPGVYTVVVVANDSSNNVNDTMTTLITINDITFPNVSYINNTGGTLDAGTPTNISVNVTDDGYISWVFASITKPDTSIVNITMFNSTVMFNTTQSRNNFSIRFNDTSATGVYVIRIAANDSRNNMNDTVTARFTVFSDTEIPNVTQPRPVANTVFNQTTKVLVSANVTDNGRLDIIYVNVTYPNGTTVNITMRNATVSFNGTSPPDNYTVFFNDTIQFGRYNLSFFANDTSNNINNSINTTFNITACECLLDNGGTETGACMVINGNCTANFNITMVSGGNITLINTTLRMNGSFTREFGIEVRNGGEMNIRNSSNITSGDFDSVPFVFKVFPTATFSMTDSHLRRYGYSDLQSLDDRSLLLLAKPLEFRNNNLTQGDYGIVLSAADAQITSNRFGSFNATAIYVNNVTGTDINENRGNGGLTFIELIGTPNHTVIRNNNIDTNDHVTRTGSGILSNLTIINNTFTTSAFLAGGTLMALQRINQSRISNNRLRQTNSGGIDSILSFIGNYTMVKNNTMTVSAQTFPQNTFGIQLQGFYNNVSDNIIRNRYGVILLAVGTENNSLVNNTITYNESGILVRAINNNITNNTFQSDSNGAYDLNLTDASSDNTIWLNHFLSLGVADGGANNNFCINSQGNFYNESIGPNRIQLDFTDCGLANITDTLDGKLVSGLLIVNWSNQSSFIPDVTYSIHADNGSLLNVTSLTNVTINTSIFHDGQHFLRIVPNITFSGLRVNGTNNQSLDFTINNACVCLRDNLGVETGVCTVANAVCEMNTNITIQAGGNTTLINTTAYMNGTADAQLGIEVQAGGELNVLNGSIITANNTDFEYVFQVLPGANFSLTDSHVSEVGVNLPDIKYQGLFIGRTPTTAIRNNNITAMRTGLVIFANDTIIERNRFFNYTFMIRVHNSSGIDILYNTGDDAPTGIACAGCRGIYLEDGGNHSLIRHNIINHSLETIRADSDTGTIVNLTVLNNTLNSTSAGAGSLATIYFSGVVSESEIVGNRLLNTLLPGIRAEGNALLIANNTINKSADTNDVAGILINGTHNNITQNTIQYDIGIHLSIGAHNSSVVNNTILYTDLEGIRVNSSNSTITNTTIRVLEDGYTDINLTASSLHTTVWLNHLLSRGIANAGTGNTFCAYNQGNFYNESIGPDRIQLNFTDCGLANITDTLDGAIVHRQLIVNWSNQSSFIPDVTYSIHADNGSLLNVTSLTNVTINTSIFHDGQHFLRIVPNITFSGLRVNGTNNQTLNFTTDNFAPNCTVVNDFGQDTDGSPFLSNNRTPSFNCTMDGAGNCRMSFTDESFTDMSDNIDCTGDSSNTTFCQIPIDRTIGDNTIFIACNNTFGINDTAADNQNFTITMVPLTDCRLSPNFRGLEFGDQNDNSSNDTQDDAPRPLILENNGTVRVNLSFNATNLWINQPNPSDFYSYLIEDNETNSYESAQDAAPFKQFQSSRWPTVTAVTNLKYPNSTNTNNAVEIEVNVTAPYQEYAGLKTSTIEILCLQNE